MRSTLRSRLTFANLVSLIALFIALSGAAYAVSVPKNSVGAKQIKKDAVRSPEVKNFSLNDEDIAQGTFVNFNAAIGTIPANNCGFRAVTGVNARGDHLLLTPGPDGDSRLSYTTAYALASDFALIKVCNHANVRSTTRRLTSTCS